MTKIVDSCEKAEEKVSLSKGKSYHVFFCKIDEIEADRLLKDELTTLFNED